MLYRMTRHNTYFFIFQQTKIQDVMDSQQKLSDTVNFKLYFIRPVLYRPMHFRHTESL